MVATDRPPRPGESGEDRACAFLRSQGYEIVARNFRVRHGEVDIVARQDGTTVFVEVKERQGEAYGTAIEAVTTGKMRRVVRAAEAFAAMHGLMETALRFDVIGIDIDASGVAQVRHEKGAFDAAGR
jgi:putative endonuclease